MKQGKELRWATSLFDLSRSQTIDNVGQLLWAWFSFLSFPEKIGR